MEEWKEYKLGNVCEVLNGRAYKQEELLSKGKYPVLRVGNIFQGNNWYYSDLKLLLIKSINSWLTTNQGVSSLFMGKTSSEQYFVQPICLPSAFCQFTFR